MKALVTGGSGYFGSLLIDKLLDNKWECKNLDINDFYGSKEVEFIKGDIRDVTILDKVCQGVDVVFHNVAQVPLAKNKKLFNSVNINGTTNLLKSCLKNNVEKVIYTSSSAIYGVPKVNPVTEEMTPTAQEAYGKAKLIGENKCIEYASKGLEVVIIRPRTIMGHGRLGIFQILFEWIANGHNIPVLGTGDNIYQFIHSDDLADAIILSADSKIRTGIYNCGAERYGSMREVLENLCDYANTKSIVKSVPHTFARMGMNISSILGISPLGGYHSLMYGESMYFDITKAKNELGWNPKFSNNEMFKESYDWYIYNRQKIMRGKQEGSPHQSRVNEGILSLVKFFL